MKNLDEEMELLAQSKDLNDARQKRCELMIRSFRTKKNPLKCKQLWLGKNILDVHLFHCKDANIIIEVFLFPCLKNILVVFIVALSKSDNPKNVL